MLSTEETEPESDVELTIVSKPNSYVGILAVDENINQLKRDYDIRPKNIIEELQRFDGAKPSPYSVIMNQERSNFFWKPGGSNTNDMFTVSKNRFRITE